MRAIVLRPVVAGDIAVFFEQQRDPVALAMADFEAQEDSVAYTARWTTMLADRSVIVHTVEVASSVAGYVGSFLRDGVREVAYWYGRQYWGQGIATHALGTLLSEVHERPIYARVAIGNAASLRVLEKCGFARVREEAATLVLRRA